MKKILLLGLLSFALYSCCGGQATEDKSINVGKSVMLEGELYTIISHDSFMDQYTLSNGTIIDDNYPIGY